MASLLALPDELIVKIVSSLHSDVKALIAVQLVCRKLHQLGRDGAIWRNICFEGSIAGRRHNRATIPKTIPPRQVQALQAEIAASPTVETVLQQSSDNAAEVRRQTRASEVAKWDSPIPGAATNWYREYIAREAAVDIEWASQNSSQEVEGIALMRGSDGIKKAVARFDDGRVGIWGFDNDNADHSRNSFTQSSQPVLKSGYARHYDGILNDQASMLQSAITDCLSIDRARQKAYIAVDCQLNEVDLGTLQLSSCTAFPRPISALSGVPLNSSLIVGTSSGLFQHDSRVPPRGLDGDQLFHLQQTLEHPTSAPGPGTPFSILQAPAAEYASGSNSSSTEIYTAGRSSPIMVYDQRTFPKVVDSIWTGSDLSCLSLLPYGLPQVPAKPGSQLPSDLRLSHTIFAGGAKNGKGSLEVHGFDRTSRKHYGDVKNRTMTSRVKLLSVVPHGKRICTSDADGNIKWFERDAFNLVRQVNVNDLMPKQQNSVRRGPSRGIFGTRQDIGDVVQKIIPVNKTEDSDLLVWAGSCAGVLKIGSKINTPEVEPEDEATTTAREYEERMRRVLEVQAVEARRMQNFGM